jgi:hypothetical protein
MKFIITESRLKELQLSFIDEYLDDVIAKWFEKKFDVKVKYTS